MDGTLVKSDTLVDSVLVLARHRPLSLFRIPGWILRGKAAFKAQVSSEVTLDPVYLPYNRVLLQFLEQQHATGRKIYLATAADSSLAERVAAYLGLFDGVLASDGSTNLAGKHKLAAFRDRFTAGYCYIGNAMPDRTLLAGSSGAMVANPHAGLLRALKQDKTTITREFIDRKPYARTFFKEIRVHQWAKNGLIFLPLLLAHDRRLTSIYAAVLAFLSFSLAASATYIINDLVDIESDRRHSSKNRRPFAAGDLSPFTGIGIIVVFFAAAILIALSLPKQTLPLVGNIVLPAPQGFLFWLLMYVVVTLSYSFKLKRMMIVDVIVLSMLYTLRMAAGAAATANQISPWLAAFGLFFFLSLAMIKRFSELEDLRTRGEISASGRGYHVQDLEQLRSFGTASAYASVVVFTLYISSAEVSQYYPHASRLWLLAPLLILWLSRMWLLASRGELHEDPVVYAITNRSSLFLGILVVLVVVLASLSR